VYSLCTLHVSMQSMRADTVEILIVHDVIMHISRSALDFDSEL
jgi:hypothetical protein